MAQSRRDGYRLISLYSLTQRKIMFLAWLRLINIGVCRQSVQRLYSLTWVLYVCCILQMLFSVWKSADTVRDLLVRLFHCGTKTPADLGIYIASADSMNKGRLVNLPAPSHIAKAYIEIGYTVFRGPEFAVWKPKLHVLSYWKQRNLPAWYRFEE